MSSNDEVIVFETVDQIELGMIRTLLETAGIPHVVHGQSTSSLLGVQLGSAFGGLQRIAVRMADEERTLDLFDQALGSEDDLAPENGPPPEDPPQRG